MKRIISCALIIAVLTIPSALAEDISVFVDGNKLEFDAPPFIENDRTLVPMRAIFESLGAKIVWDAQTHTVFAALKAKEETNVISVQIGENRAFVNSMERTLDCAAKIVNDRTFVPLRFVSESLGCRVDWDGNTQTVNISRE